MMARDVTPEDAAIMAGEAIANGETICLIAQGDGKYTVSTEVRADVDPNPTRGRPFMLSDRGDFLRRWHGGWTGQKG